MRVHAHVIVTDACAMSLISKWPADSIVCNEKSFNMTDYFGGKLCG